MSAESAHPAGLPRRFGFRGAWIGALFLAVSGPGCPAYSVYSVSRAQVRAARALTAVPGHPVAVPARDEDGVFRALRLDAIDRLAPLSSDEPAGEGLTLVVVEDDHSYRTRVGWGCLGPGLLYAGVSAGLIASHPDDARQFSSLLVMTTTLVGVGIGYLIAASYSGPEADAVTPGLPEDRAWER